MTEKELIKYIDLVIKNIDDFNAFGIKDPVFDKLKPKTEDERKYFFKLIDKIELFAKNNDLFIRVSKGDCFKLTDKGKKLKLSSKTFKNFEKKQNRNEWYNKPWVGFLIAFILLIFNIYQHFDNRFLKDDYNSLLKKYDSLKVGFNNYKDSTSQLNHQNLKQIQIKNLDSISKTSDND
ncbi:hypothetical protein [Psychroflexus sp. MBR-150]|jgi:hypothetical protein